MKRTILFCFLCASLLLSIHNKVVAQVYFNNFDSPTPSGASYTGTPTLATNISGGAWTTSAGSFTSFGGSSGGSLALNSSSGTPTYTLTLTVAAGFQLSVSSYSLWRQRSNTGAQNYTMTIKGTSVTGGTIPTTGTNTGTVAAAVSNITGTFTVVISLSGASGSGTFRLDDFTLTGTVSAVATGATKLALVSTPTTGTVATNLASFTVEARKADNSLDNTYTSNITISKASGTGTISGTLTKAAVGGVATFNNIQFNTAGTYTISAAAGSLTGATSGNIVISNPSSSSSDYFRSKQSGNWNATSTWESSSNNSTWINATLVPDGNANTTTIQTGHTVTATADITVSNTIVTGILNINPSIALTVPAIKTVSVNGTLAFKSSNVGTGRLASSAGSITGNVTMERYIAGGLRGFRFLGNPFATAMPLTELTDDIDITGNGSDAAVPPFTQTATNAASAFSYNPTIEGAGTVTVIGSGANATSDPGWVPYSTAASTIDVGNGFRVLVRGTKGQAGTLTGANPSPLAVTLSADGPLNPTGNFVKSLTHSLGKPSYNLIGNPYPSTINMKNVSVGSGANNNYWIFNVHQGTKGGYLSYAFGIDDYSLPSFGAFVAQSISASDNAITFHETDKTSTDTSNMLRTVSDNRNLVEMTITSGNIFWDRYLLQLDNKGSENRDAKWDADKFANSEVSLYSLSGNNKPLAIDVRPFQDGKPIPLGLQSNAARNFTLTVTKNETADSIALFLHDKYLGTETKMEEGMGYQFSTLPDMASQGDNRFEILQKKIMSLPILQASISFIKLSPNPVSDMLKVKYTNNSVSATSISILNEAGQVVRLIDLGNQEHGEININVKGLSKGMYYLSLNNNNERIIEKFQIQ